MLAVGLAMRLWIVGQTPLGQIDLDEASAGLQAQRMLHGHFDTFFPRQAYGGTAETALVAVSQALIGHNGFALKVVPVVLHLMAAILVWRTGLRVFGRRLPAIVAGSVLWLGPAFGVWESTKERGFYGMLLAVSAATIFLVVRAADEGLGQRQAILLGGVVGLGLWTTPLALLVSIPAGVWLLARRFDLVRRSGGLVVIGAVVGAAPWLAWNLQHGWASLTAPPSLGSTWAGRFRDLFDRLPVVTNMAPPWDPGRRLIPTAVVIIAVVVVTAVTTLRTRRQAPGLIAILVVGYTIGYPFNGLAVSAGYDPRYLYALLPALSLAVAGLLPDLDESRHGLSLVLGTSLLVGSLSSWGLVGLDTSARHSTEQQFLSSPGIENVVDLLEQRHLPAVITDESGTQITFLSHGKVKASSFNVPRFSDLERAGREADPSTYVIRNDILKTAEFLAAWLHVHGVNYERRDLGAYSVFFLDRRLPPEGIPIFHALLSQAFAG